MSESEAGYRTGMLCEISGTQYWHTGRTFWLAVGKGGREFDLREMPGFSNSLAMRYEKYQGFPGDDWERDIDNVVAVRNTLDILYAAREALYWKAVMRFLQERHTTLDRNSRAGKALRTAGFSHEEIAEIFASR